MRAAPFLLCATLLGACAHAPASPPAPPAPAGPGAAERYAALPDTSVCVVDRSTDAGLRDLRAKRARDGGAVLLVDGRIVPLASVHRVELAAGYAGSEPWFTARDTLGVEGHAYRPVEGERQVDPDLLRRGGDVRGLPFFVDPNDASPRPPSTCPSAPAASSRRTCGRTCWAEPPDTRRHAGCGTTRAPPCTRALAGRVGSPGAGRTGRRAAWTRWNWPPATGNRRRRCGSWASTPLT